jgi:NAD(P)-dependent dehydrogenase (short-subunit alcohol dehydrogenase family)
MRSTTWINSREKSPSSPVPRAASVAPLQCASRAKVQIALVDSDATKGAEVVKQIEAAGGTAKSIKADVGVMGEAQRAVDEAAKAFGRLDVLNTAS